MTRVVDLPLTNTLSNSDIVLVVTDPSGAQLTKTTTVGLLLSLYGGGGGGGGFTNGQSISVANLVITGALVANSSNGTAGQLLTSNGTSVYWSTVSGVNVAAQYVWSNTQTFSNTITFSQVIIGTANNSNNLGGVSLSTIQGQITGNAATAYSNAVANAAALYQTTAGLSANVAVLTSNNSNNFGGLSLATIQGQITGNAATAYSNATTFASNATNISSGTLNAARLPYSINQNLNTANGVTFNSISLTTGTISTAPSTGNDIVNKTYADAIATGVNFHPAVRLATTSSFDSTTSTYNNGTSGVGATITKNSPFAALTIDSTSAATNDRVLLKDSTNTVWNGVYSVTNTGSASYAWVLTRAYDYDQVGSGVNEIDQGDLIYVVNGASLSGSSWVQQQIVTTIGTSPITFVQFSSKALYTLSSGDGLYYSTGGAFDGSAAATLSVNTSYISSISSNNASYLGGIIASSYVNTAQLSSNLSNYQTTAGLSANVLTLTANAAGFLGNSSGTIANVASWITGNSATAYTNATTYASNASNLSTGTLPSARLDANVVNTSAAFTITGVHTHNANVVFGSTATIIANNVFGSNGQVLSSNGSGVYWANSGGGSASAPVRQTFIANATVNTSFAVSGGYTVGYVDVYKNGVKLINGTDVTVTSGTNVVLANPAASNDVIDVVGFIAGVIPFANSAVSVRQTFTANSTVNTTFTVSSGYTPGYIDVYYNGAKLVNGTDVTATNGSTIVLSSSAPLGTVIDVVGLTGGTILSVNTSVAYTWTNIQTYQSNAEFQSNVTIASTGELIVSNGAGIYANGTLGTNNQVLTSNGTGVSWTAKSVMTYRTITSNTTVLATDNLIVANGTLTVTLPAASTVAGQQFYIKNINNSNGIITVLPNGSELIDGYANATIRYYNTMFGVISIGTGWAIF